MEELAGQAELAGLSVHRVARHRQVDRLQVNADLMRASGLQADAEQSVSRQQLDDLEVRDGVARRIRVERVARGMTPVAADPRLDPSRARARPADDERQVLALEPPSADERLQAPVRFGRAGDDE